MTTIGPHLRDILNAPFEARNLGRPFDALASTLQSCNDSDLTMADIEKGHHETVLRKLRNGANANVAMLCENPVVIGTPLEHAIYRNDWRMVLILFLEGGACPEYNAFNGLICHPISFQDGLIAAFKMIWVKDCDPTRDFQGLHLFHRVFEEDVHEFHELRLPTKKMMRPLSAKIKKTLSAIELGLIVTQQEEAQEKSSQELFEEAQSYVARLCISREADCEAFVEWDEMVTSTARNVLMLLRKKGKAHGTPVNVSSTIIWEKLWFRPFIVEEVKKFLKERFVSLKRQRKRIKT